MKERAMTMLERRALLARLVAVPVALGGSAARAQSADAWPTRPVRLLVGFAPGGSSDIVARLIAQHLSVSLGQPFVVENRAGAGGLIAAEAVAKAAPDGYTLVLLPSGHASQAAMLSKLPFHPVDDFAWVCTATVYPMFLAVADASPIRSLSDLLQRAKANPGKFSYSSVGIGTAHHLIGEWINAEAGVEITHVPYKGGTAPLTDVLSGQVDVMIDTATTALPYLKSGRLRALAVTSTQGKKLLPGVPAASETLPNVQYESWLGIAAPSKTPGNLVLALNREITRLLGDPAVSQRLAELGGEATPSSPEAFRDRVQNDIAKFRQIVATRRITPE
jgi:tripartite-type tricarboxylate transporter receptor subunit TctC